MVQVASTMYWSMSLYYHGHMCMPILLYIYALSSRTVCMSYSPLTAASHIPYPIALEFLDISDSVTEMGLECYR